MKRHISCVSNIACGPFPGWLAGEKFELHRAVVRA